MKETPWYVRFAWKLINVALGTLGLISLSQSEIEWKGFIANILHWYDRNFVEPVRKQFNNLINWVVAHTDIDLSFLPEWFYILFPQYIPLASIFASGYMLAYSHVYKTNFFYIAWDHIQDFYSEARRDLPEALFTRALGLAVILILYILSPFLFIAIPIVFIALFFLSIAMMVFMATTVAYLIIRWVFPVVAFILIIVFILKRNWWLFLLENFFTPIIQKIRQFFVSGGMQRVRSKAFEGVKNIKKSASEEWESDIPPSIQRYFRVFYLQYEFVFICLCFALLLFSINEALN